VPRTDEISPAGPPHPSARRRARRLRSGSSIGGYRTVPGSTMYEPYRQVMWLSGVLDAAQRAEMEQPE
jgi:hypothetical protein